MTRVAVVTGAAGAMGAACAQALARDGLADQFLLTDIDGTRLDEVARTLPRTVGVTTVVGDLAANEFIGELARRQAELGALAALVNTAGLSPSMADWRAILEIDLIAVARSLDVFGAQAGAGSVALCISSVSAHMGEFDDAMNEVLARPLDPDFVGRVCALTGADPGTDTSPDPGATYRLAKRGVVIVCERAAAAWGRRGGRVVSVSPGLIDTAMGRLELVHQPIKTMLAERTPVQRDTVLPGRVDDIAEAVAFLCSPRAAFISGCDLLVDGGLLGALRWPEDANP